MEEPEIAIPPHAQKRIIESVRSKSAQALFTSHSPYVLEEFPPDQVLVLRREGGTISAVPASLPPAVKPKKYKEDFRKRFCETLLARRVLIVEGRTEYDAFPAAAKRLRDLHPDEFRSLDALGVAVINAETDAQVAPLGEHFNKLGKVVFAVYDRQVDPQKSAIEAAIEHRFEGPGRGFERTLLDGTADAAIRRFAGELVASEEWPTHLAPPILGAELPILNDSLLPYLRWAKGMGAAANLLADCTRAEMPTYIVNALIAIHAVCEPPPPAPPDPDPEITALLA